MDDRDGSTRQEDLACAWCPHPVSYHSAYYGGWCSADITVLGDGEVPYTISCWCGGTEGTAGPRVVLTRSTTRLVPDPDGSGWKYP